MADGLIPKGTRVRVIASNVFGTVTFNDGDRVTVLIDGYEATNSFNPDALEVLPK